MKKKLILIVSLLFPVLSFAQETRITLPEVTTYIPSTVEQKLVITSEDIEKAHYESVGELLERNGIQMLSSGGAYGLDTKASIRGFTDETVRVVIDGICVNNAQYGTFDFTTINLSAVEKIEIIRGGFTEGVEDEGAVAGVIYITTKKMDLEKTLVADVSLKTFFNKERFLDSCFQKIAFSGRLAENTFLSSSGSLNYASNRYLYKVSPNLSLVQGAFGGASTDGNWKSLDKAIVIDGHADANLTQYFGNGNYFSISDLFYAGHKNCPGEVNSNNSGLQRDYNNNLSFTLWNPAVAQLFNLKNSLWWLCNNRFYKNTTGTEDSHHYINTIKYTGSADFTSLVQGRIRQLIGITADYTNLKSTNDGNHQQFSGVIKETTKFAISEEWTVSVPIAVKFCINDTKVNFAFVPKAGVVWEHGLFCVSADIYRMVQFPNMDDLFWEGVGFHGNPNLIPESGWGADIGFSLRGLSFKYCKLNANFTIFSDYYKDKIKWGSGTTQNLSSAFYLGADFNVQADFFDGLWTLDVNGEYLYNRLLDKDSPLTYGKQIMWTPDFVCSVTNTLNFELLRILITATYTGRRYLDNFNLYYLKPYILVNLSVEGTPIKGRFTPYLKIDNLLNWQYQSIENFAMPGISLTIGARYCFL